ncbi:hypothetical protein VZT92_018075 [Zoarces viviparus]|uniref:Uncharacterized protein n=1 Tax=Zoarces viviparus TaxID=48416 RepID=A0AAW1ENN9_ZOAVI
MKAAALPVPPRWEERTQRRAGPAGRGLLLLPRHLICTVVGSLPFLPAALRHRDALRTNPRGRETAAGTPFDRRAQQAQPDCAPRASASVCCAFLTAPTQRGSFEPACQDKLTSPIYAPASACTRDRSESAAHRTGSRLQRRTGHFYAPGMSTFGDSGMSPAPLPPL